MASEKNDANPPPHEMAYFAGLAAAAQKNDVFRTVKWTGLYSQLVTMEVPVNGEIGDEVSSWPHTAAAAAATATPLPET